MRYRAVLPPKKHAFLNHLPAPRKARGCGALGAEAKGGPGG